MVVGKRCLQAGGQDASRKYWSARGDVTILLFKRAPETKLIALLYCIPSEVLSLGGTVGKAEEGDVCCLC